MFFSDGGVDSSLRVDAREQNYSVRRRSIKATYPGWFDSPVEEGPWLQIIYITAEGVFSRIQQHFFC